MLVLTRRPGQSIRIGDDIEVTVVEVRGEQVRLAVRAPKDVRVMRSGPAEAAPAGQPDTKHTPGIAGRHAQETYVEELPLPNRFGVHAPLTGGLMKSLQWAVDATCNAIQIFSGNPNAWKCRPWGDADCERFRAERLRLDVRPCVLHTPYLINLATPDETNWAKSKQMLADAMGQAARSGSEYVNSHIGSHLGSGMEAGVARVADALTEVLERDDSGAMVLLETTNGAGNLVGSRFEDLAAVLDRLNGVGARVGVCMDTAHVWAAGYDISTAEKTGAVLDEFERLIGLERLLCIHANDNRRALGGKSDVHQDIGEGQIGPAAFHALVNDPRLAHTAFILETPKDKPEDDRRNLDVLRGYQNSPPPAGRAEPEP